MPFSKKVQIADQIASLVPGCSAIDLLGYFSRQKGNTDVSFTKMVLFGT